MVLHVSLDGRGYRKSLAGLIKVRQCSINAALVAAVEHFASNDPVIEGRKRSTAPSCCSSMICQDRPKEGKGISDRSTLVMPI